MTRPRCKARVFLRIMVFSGGGGGQWFGDEAPPLGGNWGGGISLAPVYLYLVSTNN